MRWMIQTWVAGVARPMAKPPIGRATRAGVVKRSLAPYVGRGSLTVRPESRVPSPESRVPSLRATMVDEERANE